MKLDEDVAKILRSEVVSNAARLYNQRDCGESPETWPLCIDGESSSFWP